MILLRCFFIDLTALSQRPPKCGEAAGMWLHWILCCRRYCCMMWSLSSSAKKSYSLPSSFLAPTKLGPLSQWRVLGQFLLEMNLLRQAVKDSVERSEVTSRCTALVARQIKIQMNASIFIGLLVWPWRIEKGPAKSMPVSEKAG